MRQFRHAVTLLLVAALVACGGGTATPSATPGATATAAKPVKLVVGFSEIYQGELALWYAAAKGIFARHGLDVDLRYTESSTGVAALISGDIQIFQGGGSEVLSAAVAGEDLVLFGNLVPVYPYVFVVSSDIKTAADLKGKKVGVSRPGSTSDIATRVVLEKIGLNPDKDVTILTVGSSQNRTAALLSGSIQGGLDQPPGLYALTDKGFRVLADMVSLQAPVVNNGMSAKRAWLTANRDVAQRYVDAVVDSIATLRKDKAGGIEVFKKELKLTGDKVAEGTYDFTMKVYPAYPYVRKEHLSDSVKVLSVQNPKVASYDLMKLLDESFVKSAEQRGLAK